MISHPFEQKGYHAKVRSLARIQTSKDTLFTPHEHFIFGSGSNFIPTPSAGKKRRNELGKMFIGYGLRFDLPSKLARILEEQDQDRVLVHLPELRKALRPQRKNYYLVDHEGKPVLGNKGEKILVKPEQWKQMLKKIKS